MEVLSFASSKLVNLLNSVEKWLYKTRKYKTVVGGAILNHSSILKFWKNIISTIFFYELMFSNPKFQKYDIPVFSYNCSPVTIENTDNELVHYFLPRDLQNLKKNQKH
jgi:hypothetical protein